KSLIPDTNISYFVFSDTIMSDSEDSTVTYTTVSSLYEGRSGDVSPGEDGPPVMPKDPYAYVVATFQALPPPDYVPGPEEPEQAPPSPVYIPYEDAERFLAMPIPSPSPLTLLSSPLPQIPSPPLPASPLILPIPLPTASPPLQLLSSDRRADRPEVTLPPRKRLSIVHCSGYEAGESSAAAAVRPIEGRRADYGFVGSILKGVNTRVTELAAVQEQDTQDIYGVMDDAQGRQMEIFQRVEALVDDSQYHYETGRLVEQEAIVSR
nr:hypothetical protein [Tanacetum cinerariifolium]